MVWSIKDEIMNAYSLPNGQNTLAIFIQNPETRVIWYYLCRKYCPSTAHHFAE